jgi:hypothetical protein
MRKLESKSQDKSLFRGEKGMMPLEGLEHVLSILHSDFERQLPRNYAGSRDRCDIVQRPKTANDESNAAKMRARIGRDEEAIQPMGRSNAGKFVFGAL